jgi:hypothetical protein
MANPYCNAKCGYCADCLNPGRSSRGEESFSHLGYTKGDMQKYESTKNGYDAETNPVKKLEVFKHDE